MIRVLFIEQMEDYRLPPYVNPKFRKIFMATVAKHFLSKDLGIETYFGVLNGIHEGFIEQAPPPQGKPPHIIVRLRISKR